ncbi:MAG: hypothetical protein ACYC6A_01850 [Armatimonadota bacterium]
MSIRFVLKIVIGSFILVTIIMIYMVSRVVIYHSHTKDANASQSNETYDQVISSGPYKCYTSRIFDQSFANGDSFKIGVLYDSGQPLNPQQYTDIDIFYKGQRINFFGMEYIPVYQPVDMKYICDIDNTRIYSIYDDQHYLIINRLNYSCDDQFCSNETTAVSDTEIENMRDSRQAIARRLCKSNNWRWFMQYAEFLAKNDDGYIKKEIKKKKKGIFNKDELDMSVISGFTKQQVMDYANELSRKYKL